MNELLFVKSYGSHHSPGGGGVKFMLRTSFLFQRGFNFITCLYTIRLKYIIYFKQSLPEMIYSEKYSTTPNPLTLNVDSDLRQGFGAKVS